MGRGEGWGAGGGLGGEGEEGEGGKSVLALAVVSSLAAGGSLAETVVC